MGRISKAECTGVLSAFEFNVIRLKCECYAALLRFEQHFTQMTVESNEHHERHLGLLNAIYCTLAHSVLSQS